MRLIDTRSFRLVEVAEAKEPYAILSHRWESDEVSLVDFQVPVKRKKQAGFRKIELACKQAVCHGIRFVWIDTCCIDKTSSAELSEAINSMFCWYQKAAVCYAYLSDVDDLGPRFGESKWFTRGWTLQELLAPSRVVFYSSNWTELGEKTTMASILSTITRIDYFVLRGEIPLHAVGVARRMSWAARRETTRPEDIAYCLMGIFDVNMPMLYGEGSKAFIRLQEEILKNSEDQSLFAWTASAKSAIQAPYRGLFASSPAEFLYSRHVTPFSRLSGSQTPVAPTNRGIFLTSISNTVLTPGPMANIYRKLLIGLNCHEHGNDDHILGIELICRGRDQYLRANPHKLFQCATSGHTVTVYVAKHTASDNIEPIRNTERQHAFYFDSFPPELECYQVYPAQGVLQFSPERNLLPLGDWVLDKAALEIEVPSEWTDDSVCLILWAVPIQSTQAYKGLFDVILTPEEQMYVSISQAKKPSTLFDERVISFGAGKPSLAVFLEPSVVRGFDMFSIKVEVRQPEATS